MDRACTMLVLVVAALLAATLVSAEVVMSTEAQQRAVERIIEHHSFSPPLLRNMFGDGEVGYWVMEGSTVVTENYVRLTGDTGSEKGLFWNTEPLDMDAFEIFMGFQVHRKNSGVGGDGFALWITNAKPNETGSLMGHPASFTGVGVVFDTYDNDGLYDNPMVHVLYSSEENPRMFSPEKDFNGEHQGHCIYNFQRTDPSVMHTMRLRYDHGKMGIFLSHDNELDEEICVELNDIHLNTSSNMYRVGLSAETGGVSESHDVMYLHLLPLNGETYDHDVYRAMDAFAEDYPAGVYEPTDMLHEANEEVVAPIPTGVPETPPPQQSPPPAEPPATPPAPTTDTPQKKEPESVEKKDNTQEPHSSHPPRPTEEKKNTRLADDQSEGPTAEQKRLEMLERKLAALRRRQRRKSTRVHDDYDDYDDDTDDEELDEDYRGNRNRRRPSGRRGKDTDY